MATVECTGDGCVLCPPPITEEQARALIEEIGEGTPVAPADLDFSDTVKVPGWYGTFRVCYSEDMGDGWVKVAWDRGPGTHTMFRDHERLVRV